jgi:hypothetical protein
VVHSFSRFFRDAFGLEFYAARVDPPRFDKQESTLGDCEPPATTLICRTSSPIRASLRRSRGTAVRSRWLSSPLGSSRCQRLDLESLVEDKIVASFAAARRKRGRHPSQWTIERR